MKPNVFVSLYNTKTKHINPLTEEVILNTIKDIIKPTAYLSYNDKIKLADLIINKSKDCEYPTANRYRNFIIYFISAYTVLEMDEAGFDLLSENKLLDLIMSILHNEYVICNTLLQMCLDDTERR